MSPKLYFQKSELSWFIDKFKKEKIYLVLSFLVVLLFAYFSSIASVLVYFDMLIATVISRHCSYEAIRKKRYISLIPVFAMIIINGLLAKAVGRNGLNFPEFSLYLVIGCLIMPLLFHLIFRTPGKIYKKITTLIMRVPVCLSGWLIGIVSVLLGFVLLFTVGQYLLGVMSGRAELLIPVILIAGAAFLYKRHKDRNPYITTYKALILDLTDFYVSAPGRNLISTDFTDRMTIRKGKEDDLSIGRFSPAFKKSIDAEKIFLYFRPEDALNIPESDRNDLLSLVSEFLLSLRREGKNVYVLSDAEGNDIAEKEKLDYLTKGLYDQSFDLFFDESELDKIITGKRDVSKDLIDGQGQVTLSYKDSSVSFAMEERFRYIVGQYEDGKRSDNNVEQFYGLVKIVEYIFQYRALWAACGNAADLGLDDSFGYNMGDYDDFQLSLSDTNNDYSMESNKNVVLAERLVRNLTREERAGSESFSYGDICKSFVALRNKYIGHGTMAYSVSDELLDAVYVLALEIIRVFVANNAGALLSRDSFIRPDYVNGKQVNAVLEQNGKLYLLSLAENDDSGQGQESGDLILTYVDFLDGEVIVKGNRLKKNLLMNGRISL
ncbi:MAG: hypothetical protein K6G10_10340 [Butyrivibrio sp.]|nr:hypothetical protein [Butyrivibrio sp.]